MKKYTELLTIPIALILLWLYSDIAKDAGLHVFVWEKMGRVFSAFVIYLIAIGFVRIIHIIVWPVLYKYFDPSFKENFKWKLLSEKERFSYSFWLHVALLILFGLIVNGL